MRSSANWDHSQRSAARSRRQWLSDIGEGGTSNTSLQERVDANQAMTRDVALGKPTDPPSAAGHWTRDYPFAGLPLRPVLRNIARYITEDIIGPAASTDL